MSYMYRVTLAIGERQFKIVCYVKLNIEQYHILCENSEFENNDDRILPENGFDEGGDCCSMNCSDPCGLCLYHPLIVMIEETPQVTIEVNEDIIHKILDWIVENKVYFDTK
jgi:hypothetical protein